MGRRLEARLNGIDRNRVSYESRVPMADAAALSTTYATAGTNPQPQVYASRTGMAEVAKPQAHSDPSSEESKLCLTSSLVLIPISTDISSVPTTKTWRALLQLTMVRDGCTVVQSGEESEDGLPLHDGSIAGKIRTERLALGSAELIESDMWEFYIAQLWQD